MKFEKINKDKIKVTINIDDLNQKKIDLHSFMADSIETQSLFLDVLDMAEKDFDFSTKDYDLRVETVALADGLFVLTITRILESNTPYNDIISPSKRNCSLKISRKHPSISSSLVYKFNTFEDFCSFSNALYKYLKLDYKKISNDVSLFLYHNAYYLVFVNINLNFKHLKKSFSIITEFSTYITSSEIFIAKLYESSKPIFKNKAIYNCLKYFSNYK